MKLFFFFVFVLLVFIVCIKFEKEVYIFIFYCELVLDGLYYFYSYDGYYWDSIVGLWLKLEIGNKIFYYNYFIKQIEEQKYVFNLMMCDLFMI